MSRQRPPRRIVARHVYWRDTANLTDGRGEMRVDRVALEAPPVAPCSLVESIVHTWWRRAGGYPVGRSFCTATA